jgi:hypothetical protein
MTVQWAVGALVMLICDLEICTYTTVREGETGIVTAYAWHPMADSPDVIIRLDKHHQELNYFGNTIARVWPYQDDITDYIKLIAHLDTIPLEEGSLICKHPAHG